MYEWVRSIWKRITMVKISLQRLNAVVGGKLLKLRTEKSNWMDTLPNAPVYPVLEEDIRCDVLVVGGGEAGSLAAYQLNQRGMDVVVVDKREIAHGSSSANTGLLQYANDKTLTSCMNTFGEARGLRFYKLCEEAVAALEVICRGLEIDPQYIKRDSLYMASCPEDAPALRHEYALLQRYGFRVKLLEEEEVACSFPFRKPLAIYSAGDAEINPYRFAQSLIYTVSRKGARIYQNTEVKFLKADAGGVVFKTLSGKTITAEHAVYAAGYETQDIKANPNAVMESTYAIATQPLESFPGWPGRCLLWETARPYLYIRTTADNRIVAGGMDEATGIAEERDRMLRHKSDLLLEAVGKLFPGLPPLRAEYSWAAAFGSTHDGLPLIGPQEGFPRCFFSMGYGGNGTAYSYIGSMIIADYIEKGSSADAELFRIDRPSRSRGVPV
jgi:glycine/D-amino acid oxidase-like deaminating enzyme